MAAINFPSSPNLGDTFIVDGKIWTFNGIVWESQVASYAAWRGYTGSAGIGFTGSRGLTGPSGPAGGYTGSTGPSGPQGYTGSSASGYTGSRGPSGFNGSVGYTGSLGYTGSQGPQGIQGPANGYTGSKGDTGYTGSVPSAPYDLIIWQPGKPAAGQVLMRVAIPRPVSFLPNFSGSTAADPSYNSAATAVLSVQKNGVQVGTITYSAGSPTPTFSSSGTVSFTTGDVLMVLAPTPQDTALEGISIVLVGTR